MRKRIINSKYEVELFYVVWTQLIKTRCENNRLVFLNTLVDWHHLSLCPCFKCFSLFVLTVDSAYFCNLYKSAFVSTLDGSQATAREAEWNSRDQINWHSSSVHTEESVYDCWVCRDTVSDTCTSKHLSEKLHVVVVIYNLQSSQCFFMFCLVVWGWKLQVHSWAVLDYLKICDMAVSFCISHLLFTHTVGKSPKRSECSLKYTSISSPLSDPATLTWKVICWLY